MAVPTLWSPNHKLVDVGFSFKASSVCLPIQSVDISVTSDEPANPPGDNYFSPDARFIRNGVGDVTGLRLRRERLGNGNGRVYLIKVTAVDTAGQRRTACCAVVVPHDQSAGSVAAVNAAADSAEADCQATGATLLNHVLGPPPGWSRAHSRAEAVGVQRLPPLAAGTPHPPSVKRQFLE